MLTESSTVNGNPYTLQKTYDDLGRIATITYPDNELVSYSYDTGGNLSSAGAYATFTNYTGLGQPQSITYGNQVTTALTYNTATDSRLHSMVTTTSPAGGDLQVQNLTYGYDGDGNVLTITDGVDPTRDLSFGYDGMNRLLTASSSRQDYGQLSFEYFPSGNIEYNSRVGSYLYGGSQPHAVRSAGANTYGYDFNGNMTNRNGQAMVYDQENRLAQAGSYSYLYNYKGMRAVKNGGTPSSTTSYFNKYWECTNGACTKHIFAGSQRVASKSGLGTYYYQPDLLGGLNIATDSSGNWAETRFYYPYGEDWITTPSSVDLHHKFTDQENDPETGVYYFKARYYDPVLGRFITTDPSFQAAFDPPSFNRLPTHRNLPSAPPIYVLAAHTGPMPGRVGTGNVISSLYNGMGVNCYAYALDNPENLIDPYGLFNNPLPNLPSFSSAIPQSNYAAPFADIIAGGIEAGFAIALGAGTAIQYATGPEFWFTTGPISAWATFQTGFDAYNRISAGVSTLGQNSYSGTATSSQNSDPAQQDSSTPGTPDNSGNQPLDNSQSGQSESAPDNSTPAGPTQDNTGQVTPDTPPGGGGGDPCGSDPCCGDPSCGGS